MKNNTNNTTYKEVEKNVKRMKNFYNHVQIFVIMMLVLLLFSDIIVSFFEARITNPNSLNWIKANIWVNAVLWLFGLIIHGIYVFKFKANFIDKWEQTKMEELMKQKK
ncbi:MAG: uncharacterized membrane protein (DUF485 family) [Paraglaciecola sp.]|jgi:uncharacterized membrane protein (DUF485 family)|tara:strand:- start:843 stop:1166 length:324 start_codon:yes stop_codon:yes gene_type:complete